MIFQKHAQTFKGDDPHNYIIPEVTEWPPKELSSGEQTKTRLPCLKPDSQWMLKIYMYHILLLYIKVNTA